MKLPFTREPEPPRKPKTCLLITTMNRSHLLGQSLTKLAELTLPDELLVVDDGGSDNCLATVTLCGMRLRERGCTVRYLYTHNPHESQCSHARNVGITHTDADIIITSEPEMRFESDVIAQLLERHAGGPDVISAGTIHHTYPDHDTETIVGWVAPFIALYERQWLLDIGGWDESFPDPWGWEDTDLLTRLRLSGHGQQIVPEIQATHLWHPSRAHDQVRNEEHFKSKVWPDDIIANRGIEWGATKTL